MHKTRERRSDKRIMKLLNCKMGSKPVDSLNYPLRLFFILMVLLIGTNKVKDPIMQQHTGALSNPLTALIYTNFKPKFAVSDSLP